MNGDADRNENQRRMETTQKTKNKTHNRSTKKLYGEPVYPNKEEAEEITNTHWKSPQPNNKYSDRQQIEKTKTTKTMKYDK